LGFNQSFSDNSDNECVLSLTVWSHEISGKKENTGLKGHHSSKITNI